MKRQAEDTISPPGSTVPESARWLLLEIIWASHKGDEQHCGAVLMDLFANGRFAAACVAVPTLTHQGAACATLCGEAAVIRALRAASAASAPYLSAEGRAIEEARRRSGFMHDAGTVCGWWRNWRHPILDAGQPDSLAASVWSAHSGDLGGLKCFPDEKNGQEGRARSVAAAAEIAVFAEETLGSGAVVAQNYFCVSMDPARRRPIPGAQEWGWARAAIEGRLLAEAMARTEERPQGTDPTKNGVRVRAKAI